MKTTNRKFSIKQKSRKDGVFLQLKWGNHILKEIEITNASDGSLKSATAYLEGIKWQLDTEEWKPLTTSELAALYRTVPEYTQSTFDEDQ